jgi:hypothetical protein
LLIDFPSTRYCFTRALHDVHTCLYAPTIFDESM